MNFYAMPVSVSMWHHALNYKIVIFHLNFIERKIALINARVDKVACRSSSSSELLLLLLILETTANAYKRTQFLFASFSLISKV